MQNVLIVLWALTLIITIIGYSAVRKMAFEQGVTVGHAEATADCTDQTIKLLDLVVSKPSGHKNSLDMEPQ